MSILYKIANNSGSVVQVLVVQNSQIKLINLLSGEITVSEEFTNQMKTLRDRGLIEIVNLDATIIPVVPETEVEDFEDLPLEGDYIGQFIKVNSQNAYYRWFGNRWKKFIDTETILNSAYDENTGSLLTQLTGSIPEYGWLSTDDEPTPDDPTKMAFGIVIDVSTDTMSIKYWNGSLWKELI